jgi:hypothetical protein
VTGAHRVRISDHGQKVPNTLMSRASSRRQSQHAAKPPAEPTAAVDDPFLLLAGTDIGNHFRRKRAIIQLEQMDMANAAQIRALQLENSKLRSTLRRLQIEADDAGRMEQRYEHLSSMIMDSRFMGSEAKDEEEEEASA